MHTIIIDECTGCDLCIPPCPVDCIDIHDLPKVTAPEAKRAFAAHNRQRFEARNARLAREAAEKTAPPPVVAAATETAAPASDKSRVIAAALARSNLKKAERKLASARENGEDVTVLEAEVAQLQDEVARLS